MINSDGTLIGANIGRLLNPAWGVGYYWGGSVILIWVLKSKGAEWKEGLLCVVFSMYWGSFALQFLGTKIT